MFEFFLSFFLAFFSISLIQKYLKLKDLFYKFFSFPPLLFIYLGFISIALSFGNHLISKNFILLQTFFLLILITFDRHRKSFFQKPGKITILNKPFTVLELIFAFLIGLLLITSFLERYYTPITDYDDKFYRASAPLSWIQNKSVFRNENYNEHKNLLLYGSGLIYLWPNLFETGDRFANILFWLAFPLTLISIFIVSGTITKNRTVATFSVFLYAGTPLVYNYFGYALSPESWLGLTVLSFLYFLIKCLESKDQQIHSQFLAGITYGGFLLIKATAGIHILLELMCIHKKNIIPKKFIPGILITLFFSGYIFIAYQNFSLYGSVFGKQSFRSRHVSSLEFRELKTQLARELFVFVEFPLYSGKLSSEFTRYIRKIQTVMGADSMLKGEDDVNNWRGIYTYSLTQPNKYFSVGGLMWLIAFFLAIIFFFKKSSRKYSLLNKIFIILCVETIITMLVLKWGEKSIIPYRHILSIYAAICAIIGIYRPKKPGFFSLTLTTTLLFFTFLGSFQQISVKISYLKTWIVPNREFETIKRKNLLYWPYEKILTKIKHNTSFLVVDSMIFADYPFFLSNGQIKNTIYFYKYGIFLDNETNNKLLYKMYSSLNPEFLVIFENLPENTLVLDEKSFPGIELFGEEDNVFYKTKIYRNSSYKTTEI